MGEVFFLIKFISLLDVSFQSCHEKSQTVALSLQLLSGKNRCKIITRNWTILVLYVSAFMQALFLFSLLSILPDLTVNSTVKTVCQIIEFQKVADYKNFIIVLLVYDSIIILFKFTS